MKKVKVCYSVRDNIGDAINPLIIENIIGYQVEHAEWNECETSGIGSGLRRFFMPRKDIFSSKEGFRKKLTGLCSYRPCQLWSAGFIRYGTVLEVPTRSHLRIASVRGRLSKERIEEILGKPIECSLGDGGLLAADLLSEKPGKKYSLGIIPHQREKEEPEYAMLQEKIPGSTIIDVSMEPMEALKKIAECSCIVSSSLHGLIIADSFGIPNQRVILTDKLAGDGFKFDDYYSSFSCSPEPLNLKEKLAVDIDQIKSMYGISSTAVDQKKAEIIRDFSKYLD